MPLPLSSPAPVGSSAYYAKYSYSGADVRAYGYFTGHGDKIAWLDSMHTISYSIHEAKGDARSLGFRGVKGFSRGIRMIAGSIIMVVMQDNPFTPLMDQLALITTPPFPLIPGWSFDRDINGIGRALDELDFTRRIASSLPPFNILLQLAAENNNWKIESDIVEGNHIHRTVVDGAAVLLTGIDIIDEGAVISVNDAYMEVSYSFKALDCKPISLQKFIKEEIIGPVPQQDPGLASDEELKAWIQQQQQGTATALPPEATFNEVETDEVGANEWNWVT